MVLVFGVFILVYCMYVVEQIVQLSVSDNISSCLPCVHVHRACRVCNASWDKCFIIAVWGSVIHPVGALPPAALMTAVTVASVIAVDMAATLMEPKEEQMSWWGFAGLKVNDH